MSEGGKWTRRHWWREVTGAVRAVFSMFEGKRDARAPMRLSMFRVVLALFAWDYHNNWPQTWTTDAWVALALILFALPVSDLFAKVPVSEAAAALEGFFSAVASKSAAGAAERAYSAFGTARPTVLPGQGDTPSLEEK